MNKTKDNVDEDSSAFLDEMDRMGVTPVGSDGKAHLSPPPPAPPVKPLDAPEDQRVLEESLAINPEDSEHEIEENENLRKHSLSHKHFRALRQGKYNIQGYIDLHGYTVEEARNLIPQFINDSLSRNRVCLRIVHGKGRMSPDGIPKLKILTHKMLSQHSAVLGYCKARPVDGGSGATIFLLRRK